MSKIADNLWQINENISIAAAKSGQRAEDITLVCVTKIIPAELMKEAITAGVRVIGENRVEEAKIKRAQLPEVIHWQMIGHLQCRKVRDAVAIFELIHSVDSVKLAEEIDKRARAINKIQDILLEVNVSAEQAKYGLTPSAVDECLAAIARLPNVRVRGLMTMAPLVDDPEMTRPVFRGLRELKEKIIARKITGVQMKYLSMGMSQDYCVAIEEGANMVRIGSAIFHGNGI